MSSSSSSSRNRSIHNDLGSRGSARSSAPVFLPLVTADTTADVLQSTSSAQSSGPNSSPIKKKAFVSTVKSVDVFGHPPPLPPPPLSLGRSSTSPEGRTLLHDTIRSPVVEAEPLSNLNSLTLYRHSVRWLNLSRTLWSLVVLDAHRRVHNENTAQFIEVLSWRAQGLVTEDEFSSIYSEWISRSNDKSPRKPKRTTTVGISQLRRILFEKPCSEADLDLFVGILINDVNRRLLHSTVCYSPLAVAGPRRVGLEVCDDQWVSLSEELFFVLDSPGFGALSFDEAFFFCACVTIGMQGWSSRDDLEADVSLTTLAAITIQFIHETGGSVLANHTSAAAPVNMNSKYEVTLPMFKRYLIRKSVGADALKELLHHVNTCLERVMRLAHTSGAVDLTSSCRPFSCNSNTVGSPRLWQQAVLSAAHLPQTSSVTNQAPPPIVLFLLSDADRIASKAFRAIELAMDDTGTAFQAQQGLSISSPLESALAANDELQTVTYHMWRRFQIWGGVPSSVSFSETDIRGPSVNAHSRDPVYRLIAHVLAKYKTLQHLLVAALFDMASAHFGSGATMERGGSLMVTCASLSCDPRDVLVEFGFSESTADAGDVSELKDSCEEVRAVGIAPTDADHSPFDHNSPTDPVDISSVAASAKSLQSAIAIEGLSSHAAEHKTAAEPSKIAGPSDRSPSRRGSGKAPSRVSDVDTIPAHPGRSSAPIGSVPRDNSIEVSSPRRSSRRSIPRHPTTRGDDLIIRGVPPPPTVESTRSPTGVDYREPPSSKLELSDVEAELLLQILSTKDVSVQNKLIEQMKHLRDVTIQTDSLSIAPNKSNHDLSIAHNSNNHDLSIAPNIKNHDLSIAPNKSNLDLSIAPNNSIHDLSIAHNSNNHDLSIAHNSNNHDLSIAPNKSNHDLSIAPNKSSHDLSIAHNSNNLDLSIAPNNSNHDLSIAPNKLGVPQSILSDNDHLYLYKDRQIPASTSKHVSSSSSKLDFDDNASVSSAPSSVRALRKIILLQ